MTAFLQVETSDFTDAANTIYRDVADPVADAVFALTAALSGTGGMAGSDPGGQAWAAEYDRAADAAIRVGIGVANGGYHLSALLAQTARNYEAADVASTPHGRSAAPAATLPDPTQVGTGAFPPGAAGGSVSMPNGWGAVEHAVGRVWPNGHQDRLQAAADAWDRAADAMWNHGWRAQVPASDFRFDHLPEAADMWTVCRSLESHVETIGTAYHGLANACRDMARHIDTVHSAVEGELVSLGWQTAAIESVGVVFSVFTFGAAQVPTQGVELARIAAIAARIRALIDTFTAAARTAAAVAAAQLARFDAVLDELRALFGMRLTVATATSAARLPATARVADQLATARLAAGPQRVQVYLAQRRQIDAVKGGSGVGGRGATWANPAKLEDHFKRHAGAFGARTETEYADMASAFLLRAARERLPIKIDSENVVRIYDPATNTFGTYAPNRLPMTFFKPTDAKYWDRQPGVLQP